MNNFEERFTRTLTLSGKKRKRADVAALSEPPRLVPRLKQPAVDYSNKWFRAVRHSDLPRLEYMLGHRLVDPGVATVHGITGVFLSSALGRHSVLKRLLKETRIDPNRIGGHVTPLSIAVIAGHAAAVAALLNHPKIEVNKRNRDGSTALDRALERVNSAQRTNAGPGEMRDRAQILALLYDALGDRRILGKLEQ